MKRFFLFLIVLLLTRCAASPPLEGKYVRDGKAFGNTQGLFNQQWWNYFERGMSYAEGEFWAEAKADFEAAIRQRGEDRRRARTYGMHFVDYFPHRELGVLYYRTGQYERAIEELEQSLTSEENAKAKFYLNKARQGLVSLTTADHTPPKITISSPLPGLITNEAKLLVSGRVEDDTYVTAITVNSRLLFNELATRELPFAQHLSLLPGRNRILIQASDMSGKTSITEQTVILDTHGPRLTITEVTTSPDGSLRVSGAAQDESAIVSLKVNGSDLRAGDSEIVFSTTLPDGRFSFSARDEAGNVSEEAFDLLEEEITPALAGNTRPLLLASNSLAGLIPPPMQPAAPGKGPIIQLKGIADGETTLFDKTFIEGSALSTDQVIAMAINDTPLQFAPGKRVFFHHVAQLAPGENRFVIAAKDATGKETREEFSVNKKTAKVRELGSRMTLAVMPFAVASSSPDLSGLCSDLFQTHLHDLNRFHLLVRKEKDMEAVLTELKLSQSELVDPAKAVKFGKIVGANSIVNGTVFQKGNAIEITINHINTETTTLMASLDVYAEATDLGTIKYLMNGLALKLERHFPMVEGLIVKVKDDGYYLDLGKTSGLKPEMEVIAFREGAPIKHLVTGKVLGTDTEELGVLKVTAVQDNFSIARPRSLQPASIKEMDHIITR